MNMASIGIFIFTLIITAGNAGFVKVRCKTENVVQYGQQSVLECTVKASQEATDVVIRSVSWKKEGVDEPLLLFHGGEITKQPGYSFAEPSWNNRNMNVSLHINYTAVGHQGVYKSTVMTDRGATSSETTLKVTAKYSKPTIISKPEETSQSTGGTLVCNSVGGYPKGLIRWFGELNEEWTKSAEMEVKETKSGLFELLSKLTLLPGSTYSKYTCAVFNTSGGKEDEATFQVPDGQDAPNPYGGDPGEPPGEVTKIVAPLLVIGSVIAGLLVVVLILHRRRARQARRFSATPLMSDHHHPTHAFESDAEEGGIQEVNKDYHDTLA